MSRPDQWTICIWQKDATAAFQHAHTRLLHLWTGGIHAPAMLPIVVLEAEV